MPNWCMPLRNGCNRHKRREIFMAPLQLEKIDLVALPSLPLDQRQDLPNVSAIYFVLDPCYALLYIGRAASLRQRWYQHHRLAQLLDLPSVRIAWLQVADRAQLDALEHDCIAKFKPSLNGVMPT